MKKISLFGIVLIVILTVTSCSERSPVQPRAKDDLLKENWMKQVNTDPNRWLRNADPWFLTGYPNPVQLKAEHTSIVPAVTTSAVPVSPFNQINIKGNFQVQMVGCETASNLSIVGPRSLTDQIGVQTSKKTLYIFQPEEVDMHNVIVRIGVRNINNITVAGNGLVLGRNIGGDRLSLSIDGDASVFLSGDIKLTSVNQTGNGTVTVIGTSSSKLHLESKGNGHVYLGGHVGVESILHYGDGTVQIIGASSRGLTIRTGGNGSTTVFGRVNLNEVTAVDCSRVYAYWVTSRNAILTGTGQAVIGLAGFADTIHVNLSQQACFLGKDLRACTAYVKTKNHSHANVTADEKIFALASDQSSIFYFGPPERLSRYTTDQGMIFPFGAARSVP